MLILQSLPCTLTAIGFSCPDDYFPYSSGISCVSINKAQLYTYNNATAHAASVGGQLADVYTTVDVTTLSYYAESKGIMEAVWVNGNDPCSALYNGSVEVRTCSDTLLAAVMLSYNCKF